MLSGNSQPTSRRRDPICDAASTAPASTASTLRAAQCNPPGVKISALEQCLQPAIGYLQLGMMEEANEVIEALPHEAKTEKIVLELQVEIYGRTASWQQMREVAGFLAHEWPEDSQHWISLAYATRRCRSIAEAELILLQAVKLHPREPMIHFNLACYAAQTGELAAARERLAQAEMLYPSARVMALKDPDLKPLWPDLDKTPTASS
jgi:predicted Zn-dependent protease